MNNIIINKEKFDKEFEKILADQKPVVIFGSLALGAIVKRTLDFYFKQVLCFCDNNENRQGLIIEGLEVLSLAQIKEKYDDVKFIICSFNVETCKEINIQLAQAGFKDRHFPNVLLYKYQIEVMKRDVSRETLATTLSLDDSGLLKLERVNLSLTTYCSLKCKDCGALMPHFKKPTHFKKDDLINSIKTLAKSVDVINEVLLLGGEPFLYPEILDICDEISKIENIGRIVINTNGTIDVAENVLRRLSNTCIYIVLSDYGNLSKNKDIFMDKAKKSGIVVEKTNVDNEWIDFGDFRPRNRTDAEKKEFFRKCNYRKRCHTVLDSKFYICGRSAFGNILGYIVATNSDFVDLNENSFNTRENIKKLLNYKEEISACDYCDVSLDNKVLPAIQCMH